MSWHSQQWGEAWHSQGNGAWGGAWSENRSYRRTEPQEGGNAQQWSQEQRQCKYYRSTGCRFGAGCQFSHSDEHPTPSVGHHSEHTSRVAAPPAEITAGTSPPSEALAKFTATGNTVDTWGFPASMTCHVIGQGGSALRSVEKQSGATLTVAKDYHEHRRLQDRQQQQHHHHDQYPCVIISADKLSCVEHAKLLLTESVVRWHDGDGSLGTREDGAQLNRKSQLKKLSHTIDKLVATWPHVVRSRFSLQVSNVQTNAISGYNALLSVSRECGVRIAGPIDPAQHNRNHISPDEIDCHVPVVKKGWVYLLISSACGECETKAERVLDGRLAEEMVAKLTIQHSHKMSLGSWVRLDTLLREFPQFDTGQVQKGKMTRAAQKLFLTSSYQRTLVVEKCEAYPDGHHKCACGFLGIWSAMKEHLVTCLRYRHWDDGIKEDGDGTQGALQSRVAMIDEEISAEFGAAAVLLNGKGLILLQQQLAAELQSWDHCEQILSKQVRLAIIQEVPCKLQWLHSCVLLSRAMDSTAVSSLVTEHGAAILGIVSKVLDAQGGASSCIGGSSSSGGHDNSGGSGRSCGSDSSGGGSNGRGGNTSTSEERRSSQRRQEANEDESRCEKRGVKRERDDAGAVAEAEVDSKAEAEAEAKAANYAFL